MPYDSGLPHLTREECMTLLAGASFGRVGISVDALPAILPVTITLIDDSVVFRTVPGTKLALAAAGSILAVEVDRYEPSADGGWSVLVRGPASELTAHAQISQARAQLADSWFGPNTPEHFVRVGCDLVTGRRLDPATTTEGER
jgi:uncharacterized protein